MCESHCRGFMGLQLFFLKYSFVTQTSTTEIVSPSNIFRCGDDIIFEERARVPCYPNPSVDSNTAKYVVEVVLLHCCIAIR